MVAQSTQIQSRHRIRFPILEVYLSGEIALLVVSTTINAVAAISASLYITIVVGRRRLICFDSMI
jgi:hypothetical protein